MKFGTSSTSLLFESFQNQNLEHKLSLALKIKLYFYKINFIAKYHNSLNQTLSKHAPRVLSGSENFLFIYPRGRATPARPRISFKAVDPLSFPCLTWNGRCSKHLFTFRPRFTAPREQVRNKLHELTTGLDTPSLVTRRRNARATAHRPPSPYGLPSASIWRACARFRIPTLLPLQRSFDESNRKSADRYSKIFRHRFSAESGNDINNFPLPFRIIISIDFCPLPVLVSLLGGRCFVRRFRKEGKEEGKDLKFGRGESNGLKETCFREREKEREREKGDPLKR